jgi:hypothetical protein
LDSLWLEADFDGSVLTIERSLRAITARAVLREGPYSPEMKDLPGDSVDIADLSGIFLRRLGIPEVAVKTADGRLDPLTFPSLMRVFILHQNDSFGSILDKVQPERRKTDIIGFITKIIPRAAFDSEERLAEIQTRVQHLHNRFEHVRDWLTSNDVPSTAEAERRLASALGNLAEARGRQQSIQDSIRSHGVAQAAQEIAGQTEQLRREVLDIQARRSQLVRHLMGLRQEAARIQSLIASLNSDAKKATRLQASATVLSSVDFDLCPRCLLDITVDMRRREEYGRCCLCNRPLTTSSDNPPRLAARAEDIDEQLDEARRIYQDIEREIEDVSLNERQMGDAERRVSEDLDLQVAAYISPSVDALLAQTNEVSQFEVAVGQARALVEQALGLQSIQAQLTELMVAQEEIRQELSEARRRSRARLAVLRSIYQRTLEEVRFPNSERVDIQPRTLMPLINGQLYVHTGTAFRGLATLCYHAALLELSMVEDTFFPQLLVIDSPAVGDLNDENHDRMLEFLAGLEYTLPFSSIPDEVEEPWQLILTTRRTIPQLARHTVMEISGAPGRMLLREHESAV